MIFRHVFLNWRVPSFKRRMRQAAVSQTFIKSFPLIVGLLAIEAASGRHPSLRRRDDLMPSWVCYFLVVSVVFGETAQQLRARFQDSRDPEMPTTLLSLLTLSWESSAS